MPKLTIEITSKQLKALQLQATESDQTAEELASRQTASFAEGYINGIQDILTDEVVEAHLDSKIAEAKAAKKEE
tara:strand:+ start:815 stop:1036 length:222 start_codon:yes stop_codon:yes gene_type:complete